MVIIANRIQIPFSFNYPSGGNLVPAANVSVGVYTRNNDGSQGSPASVFQSQSGTSQFASLQTDAGGNVPGWVNEGTYKIVAASSGGFGGGTINFDALYGGGTSQIAVGAVGPSQIQAGAVDVPQLATGVSQALVPSGTILDFAGISPPSGFLSCNGSIVSQSTYPALYAAIGTTWNTGGEGTGNFRLPNATNRLGIGSGGTLVLGHSGGTLGHTHTPGSLGFGVNVSTNVGAMWVTGTIPALTVNAHSHSLSGNGWVQLGLTNVFGNFALNGNVAGNFSSGLVWYDNHGWSFTNGGFGTLTNGGFALAGTTDSDGSTTAAANFGTGYMLTQANNWGGSGSTSTSSGVTGTADPPYIVVNKIIKT